MAAMLIPDTRSQPSCATPGTARTDDAGFTLLEVLVAFVIAALALGVLFEGAVEGIRSARIADRTQEAMSRAQSHLATVGHGVVLAPSTQEGEDGSGFHWSLRIVRLQSAAMGSTGGSNNGLNGASQNGGSGLGNAQGMRAVLYAVQVTESWPDEAAAGDHTRSVTLRTERLGQQQGAGP